MTASSLPVIIVCGADHAYACPLAVLLRSVVEHARTDRNIEFHVIDSGLTPDDRERISSSLIPGRDSIRWIQPTRERVFGLPLWGRMSIATYDKLLIPNLLGPGFPKALWLDADILALDDVGKLWDLPLDTNLALAAADWLVPTLGARFGVAGWRELGLDRNSGYFNAGVMLMDLAAWRREHITERCLDYLRQHHDDIYFWDQEGLNAVLAGRWGGIDPGWNVSPDRLHPGIVPKLVHFTGNLKPWRQVGNSEWHERYYRCMDQTSWHGWRPTRTAPLLAWYQTSRLRHSLRWIESWGMRFQRRLSLHSTPHSATLPTKPCPLNQP